MTKWYMMTLPRSDKEAREIGQLWDLMHFMIKYDVHKWIIAKETGNNGYKHWQVRLYTSIPGFPPRKGESVQLNANGVRERSLKEHWPMAHIEESSGETMYERKEGEFYTSEDTLEILKTRFGELREWQKEAVEIIMGQNDREVDIFYDPDGKSGKSFLVNHLYETGKALYINPFNCNITKVQQDICSAFEKRRYDIICIDIPRTQKWTADHYIVLEALKDGLVADPRYNYTNMNIRGAKIAVFCNTKPNQKNLTDDRMRVHELVHTLNTVQLIHGTTTK